mmetsp:Transcript_55092/g.175251  ORF Transcript_55092/g.175251 Transcript_55092/m.175251 type:complete len:403 (-) Transcript_55092:3587-4795(-)
MPPDRGPNILHAAAPAARRARHRLRAPSGAHPPGGGGRARCPHALRAPSGAPPPGDGGRAARAHALGAAARAAGDGAPKHGGLALALAGHLAVFDALHLKALARSGRSHLGKVHERGCDRLRPEVREPHLLILGQALAHRGRRADEAALAIHGLDLSPGAHPEGDACTDPVVRHEERHREGRPRASHREGLRAVDHGALDDLLEVPRPRPGAEPLLEPGGEVEHCLEGAAVHPHRLELEESAAQHAHGDDSQDAHHHLLDSPDVPRGEGEVLKSRHLDLGHAHRENKFSEVVAHALLHVVRHARWAGEGLRGRVPMAADPVERVGNGAAPPFHAQAPARGHKDHVAVLGELGGAPEEQLVLNLPGAGEARRALERAVDRKGCRPAEGGVGRAGVGHREAPIF